MDNITHTLAGALIGQMGLKRRSRFAMAACLLGANAPDIDVFAPLVLPVQGISFHRGPVHGIFAWPILAAGIVAILWLVDRIKPRGEGALPFRPGPLFAVAFLAVLTHPFLDWLTTYAIALFAPASWHWYSGDAIFIVDWVYWLLMIAGVAWSAVRWRRHAGHPGRPAQIAGCHHARLHRSQPRREQLGRADDRRAPPSARDRADAGGGKPAAVRLLAPEHGMAKRRPAGQWRARLRTRPDPVIRAASRCNLDDPRLAAAKARDPHVRAFLVWSRMPMVLRLGGRAYLTDQRFYSAFRSSTIPAGIRKAMPRGAFLIPLDTPARGE